MRHLLSSCLALAAPALAQTYIVDANSGPGTSFTSIVAAVAAVPSGSVLVVRPGTYTAFTITAKSLTVLSDPGAVVQTGSWNMFVQVAGLTAGQCVVLRDLQLMNISHYVQPPPDVRCSNCAGTVMIEGLRTSTFGHVVATACSELVVRGPAAGPGVAPIPQVVLTDSNAVLEACVLVSTQTSVVVSSATIVQQGSGSVQLVDCTVQTSWNADVVSLGGGDLRLLRGTSIVGGTHAVGGTGTVRVDNGVTFTAAVPFAPTLAVTNTAMPSLMTTSSGNPLQVNLRAPAGHFAGLAIALPGQPVLVPGFADAIWLDPLTLTWIAAGIVPATQSFVTPIPLPPLPQAFTVAWQAYTWDAATGILISNPSLRVVQ